MKRKLIDLNLFLILLSLTIFSNNCFSQVSNDSCISAIDLGLIPGGTINGPCMDGEIHSFLSGSTINALPNFPYPTIPQSCGGYTATVASPANDVWYKLQVDCDFTFQIENSDTVHLSIWMGDSCSNLYPLACYTNPSGNVLNQLLVGLGYKTLWMQISGQNTSVNTNFSMCIIGSNYSCSPTYSIFPSTPVSCMQYNVSHTDCISMNSYDGIASIHILNGNGPYTCTWDDGNLSDSIRPYLNPGIYHFKITDVNGCIQHDSVTINLSTTLHENIFEAISIYYSQELSILKISSKNNSQLKHVCIMDATSRIILEKDLNKLNSAEIKLNIKSGIYFVNMLTDSGWIKQSFVRL